MFDNIRINLLGAYKTERFYVSTENKNRQINALAMRLDGEAKFEYEKLIAVHFETSGFACKKMIVFAPIEKRIYENIFESILSSLMEIKTSAESTKQQHNCIPCLQ